MYFFIFVFACFVLGLCGARLPDEPVIPGLKTFQLIDADLNSMVWLSRVATAYYFAYFLIVLPVMGLSEKPLPQPESISEPVLSPSAAAPAGAVASPEKRG
jgi:ubiquinol-cytochrome c reductase cytochrome b subunit